MCWPIALARYAPIDWAKWAIAVYRAHGAGHIVAEVNNGGEMVENMIRMVDPNVPFTAVRASRGKVTRAEPVSALCEQGRMRHVGTFSQLEDQMANFTSDFNREKAGYSPGRGDTLVWATTELLIEQMKGYAIFELYRHQAEAKSKAEAAEMAEGTARAGISKRTTRLRSI